MSGVFQSPARGFHLVRAHVRTALSALTRTPVLSAVSILTMSATLTLLGAHQLLSLAMESTLADLGTEARLALVLKDAVTDAARLSLAREINALDEVARVDYVSREAARDNLKKTLGAQAAVLDTLPENPLPASLEITLQSGVRGVDTLRRIASKYRAHPAVDEVVTAESAVLRLEAETTLLRISGTAIGILLILATLLLVANTIRLTVYARRDEIAIMTLCGATDAYVRTPFIIEGAIHGVIGTALATSLLFGAHFALAAPLADLISRAVGLSITLPVPSFSFVLSLLVIALAVGVVGSAISVRRFLRT
ncbi:MAG: ABC transporter permease [Deltaproteobacteria bacterium]|nr:ABC transporter permease [Deltaproteobacteria bacterium]